MEEVRSKRQSLTQETMKMASEPSGLSFRFHDQQTYSFQVL